MRANTILKKFDDNQVKFSSISLSYKPDLEFYRGRIKIISRSEDENGRHKQTIHTINIIKCTPFKAWTSWPRRSIKVISSTINYGMVDISDYYEENIMPLFKKIRC